MKQLLLIALSIILFSCEKLPAELPEAENQAAFLKAAAAENFDFDFYDHESGENGIPLYIWNTTVTDPPGRHVFNQSPDWSYFESYGTEDNGVFTGFRNQNPEDASEYQFKMNWGHSFSVDQDFIYSFWYKLNVRSYGSQDPPWFTANNLAGGSYLNPYIDSSGGDDTWTNVVLTGYPNANDQAHVYFTCLEDGYIDGNDGYCLVDSMILLPQEPVITVDSFAWNYDWEAWMICVSVPDYFEDYEWDHTGAELGGEVVGAEHRAIFAAYADETVTIENRIKYDGVWYGWHDIDVTTPDSSCIYKSDFSSSVDGWAVWWGTNGAGTMGYSNDELTLDVTTYATSSSILRPRIKKSLLTSGHEYSFKIEGTGQLRIIYYNSTGSHSCDVDLNDGAYWLSDVTANISDLMFYFNGVDTHGGYSEFEISNIEVWEKI